MSISLEVNEILVAVWGLSHHLPSLPLHSAPPVCAHTVSRNATAPPSRPAQTDQNFPWVVAQRYGAALARSPALPESWVARCLFPSPPFPDPNGDVSGSAWEGLDLPGTGGGKGVAMTASVRFLAFLNFAPSSLSPLSRPAGLRLSPRTGWGESGFFFSGPPLLHALRIMRRPPPPPPSTHIPGSPRLAAQAGGGSPRPRKRAVE